MQIRFFIFFILLLLGLTQCENQQKPDDTLVAKVYESALYESDIESALEEEADNGVIRAQYVDSWIRKSLFLEKAALSKSDQQEIGDLIDQYRSSLIIQKHKERFVERNLNKKISEAELNDAYASLKNNYKLRYSIFKIELVVTPAEHQDRLDLINYFKKKDIEEWRNSFASQVDIHLKDTSRWHSWEEINQYIPHDLISEEEIDRDEDYFRENDSNLFFIRVYEKIDKNEIAPLSYMKDKLERAILENRKQLLLSEYSSELYNKALQQKKIKIAD